MLNTIDTAPVISIINSLIEEAVKLQASDIHLEMLGDRLRIRYRIDGVLKEVSEFSSNIQQALISRIKIMSELDIAERRLPQDGRLYFPSNKNLDIRVSTLPTIHGEKVVLRILDKQAIGLALAELGFAARNMEVIRELLQHSNGMLLATGPTGSGKTTTLHSIMAQLNSPDKNIVTIEDPVEYRLYGVNQVQVNRKAGLTFAKGLRSILRQDPNIIMVGEVRDQETAEIAIRAALTGHLVLSTLHTNDAVGALPRLLDMGIERFLVCSAVIGVIAQRLARKICPECRHEYRPETGSVQALFLKNSGFSADNIFYRGSGCSNCNHTGYKGRIAIQEVLPVTPGIRAAVMAGGNNFDILTIAKEQGLVGMRADGIYKAAAGITTIEEVIRIAYTV